MVLLLKWKFKSKKRKRGRSHILSQIFQQNFHTHHLKSNPKFWSFASKILSSEEEVPWLPTIKIKVEKPFGCHNLKLR